MRLNTHKKRRVVITGMGIVSSIGNNKPEVLDSLQNSRSGIVASEEYKDLKMRSHVCGAINVDKEANIDRKTLRFMGDAAAYAHIAMQEAIEDSALDHDQISNYRTGLLLGTGGASPSNVVIAADNLRNKGIKRVGPYMVTKTMGSTVAACLSTAFKIKGTSYSISSACATSAHCIGHGAELIEFGKQDIVFAGGGEELDWTLSSLFDGMGALSSRFNDVPHSASRPYDVNRDGFVISGGAGVVVLEELEHALARNAPIYAELTGYGVTSDGHDMVQPSGEGASRCMKMALATSTKPVDYINTHGTSTPVGDVKELHALKDVFKEQCPPFSSTKALTGHALGAAGVNETIYCLLMMKNKFMIKSNHIENLDPAVESLPVIRATVNNKTISCIMNNSFGFGGTNCSLVFQEFSS